MALASILRRLFGGAGEPPEADVPPRPTLLRLGDMPLPGRPEAAFFGRLPAELGDHLVCLEGQGGQVKAHTLAGSAMVPLKLGAAIAELDGVEGLRVHRSWWVAREAVREARREGRLLVLELGNGMTVPVARARERELTERGWL